MAAGNRTLFRVARRASWAAWLLVGITACTAQHGIRPPGDETAVEELPILWQAGGTWSHVTRPARIVAYDDATLAQVPITDVPVDFSKQMVLIAAAGPTFGEDFGIRITRVWREGSQVRVQECRLHPGLERSRTLERSSPWTVVVVPRCPANVKDYTSRVPPGLMGN